MAKKVRFRLWFHKLNIKRFSNTSHPVKRRSFLSSPPHPHPLDILGLRPTSALPFQGRHSSTSSPDHSSVSAKLLSSPSNSLPLTFSSPRLLFFSPRHSLPGTSLPRSRRKGLKSSKPEADFSSAVLLSPINCKALDIRYPSGSSSPSFTFRQSPTLKAAIAMSPGTARISSPPIVRPHTGRLFRSPLHPLASQNSDIHGVDAKTICVAHGRDAKTSSRKAEITANCGKTHADCNASAPDQVEEESNPINARHTTRTNSHVKQLPLIVDCGCNPGFSSSFRKTKKTLQACASCSSNKPGIIPALHSNPNKDAMWGLDRLRSARSTVSGEESKNSMACIMGFRQDVCPVLATQDHHSLDISHKNLQLKKRKKRMDAAEVMMLKNPNFMLKQQEIGHKPPHITKTIDKINRETKATKKLEKAECNTADSKLASSFGLTGSFTKDAALSIDPCTLSWEKDFSSFTSEDTFFSSFERSRPSFSSNSSSECLDRKLSYSKLAVSRAHLVSTGAHVRINHTKSSAKRSTDDLNLCKVALISSNALAPYEDAKVKGPSSVNSSQSSADGDSLIQLQNTVRSMKGKGGDPLVEVSFHAVHVGEDDEVTLRADTNICAEAASEHTPYTNNNHGMKRSSLNPLVEIKEDPCEDGDTDTAEMDKICGNIKCRSTFKDLNLQKKLNLNADYTSSSHSDYYANANANRQRRARVRKKSDVNRSKGSRGLSSARIRRRAQLQAKWRLSEEQIHWQTSEDDYADHGVCCTTSTSQPAMPSNLNDHGLNRHRRRAQDMKHKHTKLTDSSMETSMAAAVALPDSGTFTSSSCVMDDLAPCSAAEMMLNASDYGVASKCVAERDMKEGESINVNKQTGYATNPRLVDSVAVVKCSKDPLVDFRESMVDMIIEKQMYTAEDLGELLQCFLSLNSCDHHAVIVQAFAQVWGKLFHES